jgi:hypothetical protein
MRLTESEVRWRLDLEAATLRVVDPPNVRSAQFRRAPNGRDSEFDNVGRRGRVIDWTPNQLGTRS